MFDTIKPNREYWSRKIPFLKRGRPNPLFVFSNDDTKFSEALESFKFNHVGKQTGAGRHSNTQAFLEDVIKKRDIAPVILDIGASDGSTSLRLMNLINDFFTKYYVTDYNISCRYFSSKQYTYFFNPELECILVANDKFVFYPSNKMVFDFLFQKKINEIQKGNNKELLLVNRTLLRKSQNDNRIQILRHNIFETWPGKKADIIIVGNLLHRYYFDDTNIEKALRKCYEAMNDNSILAIIRNLPAEDGGEAEESGIYMKNSSARSFVKLHEVNGGTEINDLLLGLRF